MTTDATVTEIAGVGRTVVPFEVVPASPRPPPCPRSPASRSVNYVFADSRGNVDWAALVAGPGR